MGPARTPCVVRRAPAASFLMHPCPCHWVSTAERPRQFARLRFAVETLSFVYNVPGHEGDDRVYLIRRGRVRAEASLPKTSGEAASLLGLIDSVYSPAEPLTGQIPTHEIDELLLLSSWFRRFPSELERTSAARGVMSLAEAS